VLGSCNEVETAINLIQLLVVYGLPWPGHVWVAVACCCCLGLARANRGYRQNGNITLPSPITLHEICLEICMSSSQVEQLRAELTARPVVSASASRAMVAQDTACPHGCKVSCPVPFHKYSAAGIYILQQAACATASWVQGSWQCSKTAADVHQLLLT
jgi:hypothetical protein